MQGVGALTPLDSPLAHVRKVVAERFSSTAQHPPVEQVLTANDPTVFRELKYPEVRLILSASVEIDSFSEPRTHVVVFWAFNEEDALIGMASRRRTMAVTTDT